jgi:hypothetical protein
VNRFWAVSFAAEVSTEDVTVFFFLGGGVKSTYAPDNDYSHEDENNHYPVVIKT